MTNLVVGASGFIGRRLLRPGDRAMVRQIASSQDEVRGDLLAPESLRLACEGIDTIFHCGGYAHAFTIRDPSIHWRINYEGTRNLIQAAGESGVKRFVFLSSVKAMGDPGDICANEEWSGVPDTPYGQAKLAAEKVVLETGEKFNMHVVNLRLSMVYGYGGGGNLERMAKGIHDGWFPPLPETGNKRSLVHVQDVVSVMRLVTERIEARSKTYIVAGSEAWSGCQIYDMLRAAQLMPPVTWRVPEQCLRASGILFDMIGNACQRKMIFNTEVLNRLLCSSWYSAQKIEDELGWRANVRFSDGIREMLGIKMKNL